MMSRKMESVFGERKCKGGKQNLMKLPPPLFFQLRGACSTKDLSQKSRVIDPVPNHT
jgi:hypothetical protein